MESRVSESPEQQDLLEHLLAEQCTCIVRQGEEVRMMHERGVMGLYQLLMREPEFLRGASVVDKVVGKAAAALMIIGGVKELYTPVISRLACELLERTEIKVDYLRCVPHIINRTQTGWCPLETRCAEWHTPEECLQQIEEFIKDAIPNGSDVK